MIWRWKALVCWFLGHDWARRVAYVAPGDPVMGPHKKSLPLHVCLRCARAEAVLSELDKPDPMADALSKAWGPPHAHVDYPKGHRR